MADNYSNHSVQFKMFIVNTTLYTVPLIEMPFHPKPPKVHLAAGEAISCRRGWVQWENSSRSDATQRPDFRKCGNASTQK